MQSFRQQATLMLRGSKNSHRFICFINGKIRSFCTSIDDIDSQVAALFGALNNLASPQAVAAGALLVAAMALTPSSAYALDPLALPTGYNSISGNHQFSQGNGVLNVTTNSKNSIVNYNSFNIGSQAQVNFNLPSARSSILNRVTGGGMSEIYGTMTSNGRVFLVNPAGIFFGNGANVSVNGLVASTLGITDQKFLAGQYEFSRAAGSTPGHIQIEPGANINILNGGSASFLASSFTNAGTINAPGGAIQVGVGDRMTLGDELIGLTVNEALKDTLDKTAILNAGTMTAAQVQLVASTLKQNMLDAIVNNTGRISANKVVDGEGGVVELIADNGLVNNSGVIDASGTQGGQIVLHGESSQNSGQLLATGLQGAGGDVDVLGNQSVALTDNALVDVSGQTAGGTVLIGGDYKGGNPLVQNALYTFVGENALINANALNLGNGGKVIVWGSEATGYFGTILARGGANGGNGGFVETSGKNFLMMQGQADASAIHANGQSGTWLLDPRDVFITNNTDNVSGPYNPLSDTTTYTPTGILFQVSEIKAGSINSALNNGTNVVINTGNYGLQDGDIRIQSNILKSSGSSATLSLFAADDISLDSTGSIKSTSNNPLNVILKADNDVFGGFFGPNNGNGSITLNGEINLKAGNVTLSGQSIDINKTISTSNGDVDATALGGNIRLNGDVLLQSGDVTLNAAQGVELNKILRANNGDVSITAQNGNITENALSGSVSGVDLIADANGTNHAITMKNADFKTAKLTTDSGSIDYTDTDGVSVTAKVGNNNAIANITSGLTGTASNDAAEANLTIVGINAAKELNFTAKTGQVAMNTSADSATANKVNLTAETGTISQQAGTITGNASVTLKANGVNGSISQSGGAINAPAISLEATKGIQQSAGSIKATAGLDITSHGGLIQQTGGSLNGVTVTINNTAGGISQSAGSIKGDTSLEMTATGGNITQSGTGSITAPTTKLTVTNGAITQSGGTLQGSSLTAVSNTAGQTISVGNADFASATLTSNNGNITYNDKDGVSVTVNAGNSQADITTFATGATANNTATEADLVINGANVAKDLNLTAKQGNILLSAGSSAAASHNATLVANNGGFTESGGSLNGSNALNITTKTNISQTGGTMNGASVTLNSTNGSISQTGGGMTGNALNAQTNTSGQTISLNNADFASATLTSNNGNITYNDADGVSVTTNAGANQADITTFAAGTTANNTTTEADLVINGINAAKDLNLTAKQGNILLSAGSSAAASHNATLVANNGGFTESGGSLSGTNALSITAKTNISQTGGTMNGASATLNSTNGSISQTGGGMTGNALNAQTNTFGQTISINNADFASAKLTSNNGNITYNDKDGVSVTVNAGSNQANITAFAIGATADNGTVEADLAISGASAAKDLNLTARQGNIMLASGSSATASNNATLVANNGGIIETGGSLSANNALTVTAKENISQTGGAMKGQSVVLTANNGQISQTGGDLTGQSLQATTLASGKTIEIDHADFKIAQLTTNNGNIQFSDTDGVSVNVNAGSASATIQAETGSNMNGNSESGITLTGDNVAHSINLNTQASSKSFFNLTAGDINQASGSTITGHELIVSTNVGNVKLDRTNANDVDTLTATSKSGGVSYQDKNGVTLNSVDLNSDHNSSRGDLIIQTHGIGGINQTGAVVGVDTVSVQTDSGQIDLSNDSNDANNLNAYSRNGNVTYHDVNGFNIAGVNLDSDFNGSAGNLTVQANSDGNITQSGAIAKVDTLSITTDTGNAFIIHALNDARQLEAKSNQGSISYRDIDDINVKSANLDQDGNNSQGNLSIQTAFNGNISQSGLITGVDTLKLRTDTGDVNLQLSNSVQKLDAGTNYGTFHFTNAKSFGLTGANMNMNGILWKGDLDLTAETGTITQSTAINAGELKITGNAELTNANNTVDVFSAFGNGATVSFVDKNGFNLGHSNVGSGTLNLETVSGNINQDDYSGLAAQILRNRNITGNGGTTAGTLNLKLGTGASATLTDEDNAISRFSLIGNQSSASLVNSTDLTITSATDANGILDTTITGGHNLTQTGAIHLEDLKVTMRDGGDFTLGNAGNDVQSLSANATGENTTNSQGAFVDGNGGFRLAASDLGNGDLSLEARNGGNITQTSSEGRLPSGGVHADELKITMTGGGDANLTTQANRVNVLSANADSANSQLLFGNEQNLNLAASNLAGGDLGITLYNGGSLDQNNLAPSRDITTTGGIHGNELSVSMVDGGSADLTTQVNTVDVFSGNASGDSATSVVKFNNLGNLNLAKSDVAQGQLIVSTQGNLDNRNLDNIIQEKPQEKPNFDQEYRLINQEENVNSQNSGASNRDITQNDSTLKGHTISLQTTGNGNIDLYNNVEATSAIHLITANNTGGIQIYSDTNVTANLGSVYINTNHLGIDGAVQGQLVQIWPWNLSLSMGIGGAHGGLLLSQALINHINNDPNLGLNTLMFGHQNYKGTITLGTLDLSRHTNSDAAFNAPRVFDATPNNDDAPNVIMASNRDVYFTAGADKVTDWASAPGGVSYGDNRSLFSDLDVNVRGNGLIFLRLIDFTGVGNSYAILTGGGYKGFINAQEQNNSGSLKNLASALASRTSSLIINQIKGNTIILPGNPVNNKPTEFGNIRPVQFIPNQSF